MFDTVIFRRFIVVTLWSLAASAAQADVLVFKNGDRITGEIKRIWDDEITIETEYSDEFQVDLPAIAAIESEREFEVDFYDGRSVDARLLGVNEDGEQVFQTDDGVIDASLEDMLELTEQEEIYDWDASIEASVAVNRGNTDSSTGKVRAYGMFKHHDHRHIGDLELFRETLARVPTKDRDLLKYSYNFLYSDRWYFTVDASAERDPITLLDGRFLASAGVGLDIWNTPDRFLSIKLGVGVQSEKIDQVQTEGSVANWGLNYNQDFFSDDMSAFHRQTIVVNLTGRENTSYRTSTGLAYEFNDLLSSSVSLDYNYETNPAESAKNEDLAFLFGLIYEF